MLKELTTDFWQSGWDFLQSHFYISPFWGYLIAGALIVAFFTALGWYFSFLRPVAGIVFVAVASALFGYREGEIGRKKHDEKVGAQKPPEQPREWKW